MSPRRRRWLVANRKHGLALGIALQVASSLLLWDAFEHRGRKRPWGAKLLPGP